MHHWLARGVHFFHWSLHMGPGVLAVFRVCHRECRGFPLVMPLFWHQQPDASLGCALSILEWWLLVSNQVSAAWSSPEQHPCGVASLSAAAWVHLLCGLTPLAPHSSPPLVLSVPSLLQRKRLTRLTPWLEYKAVISSCCCMPGTRAAVS